MLAPLNWTTTTAATTTAAATTTTVTTTKIATTTTTAATTTTATTTSGLLLLSQPQISASSTSCKLYCLITATLGHEELVHGFYGVSAMARCCTIQTTVLTSSY